MVGCTHHTRLHPHTHPHAHPHREDTAKYLLNLDVNSAHYDPKTRAMREDPTPWKAPGEKTFAGENFVRQTGDYQAWQALNLQSITAYEAGQDMHNVAEPSAAAILFQQQQVWYPWGGYTWRGMCIHTYIHMGLHGCSIIMYWCGIMMNLGIMLV